MKKWEKPELIVITQISVEDSVLEWGSRSRQTNNPVPHESNE